MTRRICVVTGTRAEYGLLRWVMEGIRQTPGLELQVIVTGAHLSPEFGMTYREIENDGFTIDRRVEILLSSDSPSGVSKSMGLALIGFADAFQQLSPDMCVALGDRFEIFAVVAAAMIARIPVAHLHGGEKTEGALDDPMRHSITKMSHLHFVAAEEYRRRVIQLGEDPGRVYLVGGLGIDNIVRLPLLDRAALERELEFTLGAKNLLVTLHPATATQSSARDEMEELLGALDSLHNTHLIFTMPNADMEGRALTEMVRRFVAGRDTARAYTSLGQLRYLSCVAHVDGVVGNSSSGLIEVPSMHKGTINIGDRQRGRLKAESVIDCAARRTDIGQAIAQLYSADFQSRLGAVVNPYGDGGASARVVQTLSTVSLDRILQKQFFDLVQQ